MRRTVTFWATSVDSHSVGGTIFSSLRRPHCLDCLQTRAAIQSIKDRLDIGLAALASTATGNPAYAAQQLDGLKPLVLPLLASPIVGEGSAYNAAYALARCLPGALHDAAFAVASALQMVMQSQLEGRPRTLYITPGSLLSTHASY